MANNLYLVFSEWPDGLDRSEFHAWYAEHAQENIESPDFVSAQRYSVRNVAGAGEVGYERHLAVYEYEPPMSKWRTDLSARLESGEVELPDWFGRIGFTSWNCTPTGPKLRPHGATDGGSNGGDDS